MYILELLLRGRFILLQFGPLDVLVHDHGIGFWPRCSLQVERKCIGFLHFSRFVIHRAPIQLAQGPCERGIIFEVVLFVKEFVDLNVHVMFKVSLLVGDRASLLQ